jgi:hypothetical protein
VSVLPVEAVGVADILGAATLVVSREALDHITSLAARSVKHATQGEDARSASVQGRPEADQPSQDAGQDAPSEVTT